MGNWRKRVFIRDNYKCRWCGDRSRKGHPVKLNAHHVRSFAHYPALRFVTKNGITLCRPCHEKTIKREDDFVEMFDSILSHEQNPLPTS
jgi:5-methylcytosine-specific restriction endonuclease McrA